MVSILLALPLVLTSFAGTAMVQELEQPNEAPPMDSALDARWTDYKKSFGKNYSSTEDERYRRHVWEDNLAMISKHNYEAMMGKQSYWMGVNQFTDMTTDEFSKYMLSGIQQSRSNVTEIDDDDNVEMTGPSAVDWRAEGLVTNVKDQGKCGSCWAFSTTGAIEGQHAKKTGKLVPLSEQQLVDCSRRFGNRGCNGGFMWRAYKYVMSNRYINSEECYPYTGKQGACKAKSCCIGATIKSYRKVARGERNLSKATAEVGPIAVAIYVTPKVQHYSCGIFVDTTCPRGRINHAALVVGYQKDFWIIKNSWGYRWGMEGYVRWARNIGNMCGVASYASYPVL